MEPSMKRSRLSPQSPQDPSSVFPNHLDDLDDLTIAHLLSFADAPSALRLAKCSRRLSRIYTFTRNLRLFHRYDIVIVEFSMKANISWKARLSNSTINQPTKPLFVRFVEQAVTNSDFILNDGALNLHVKVDKNESRQLWMKNQEWQKWMTEIDFEKPLPTMNCYVAAGTERRGLLMLFKFLQERLAPLDRLFLKGVDAEVLNFFARHSLPLIRHLHILPSERGLENNVLRLIEAMPELEGLALHGFYSNFAPQFYDEPAVNRLNTFAIFGEQCNADVHLVKWKNFVGIGRTNLTPNGIKKLLDEWKEDQREIGVWFFNFNDGTWTTEQVVERIFGDSVKKSKTAEGSWDGVVESKSGKNMKVLMVRNEVQGEKTLVFTTNTDKGDQFWRGFVTTWIDEY